jgi:peroxiredoxin
VARSKCRWIGLGALLGLSLSSPTVPTRGAEEGAVALPRYRLEVGQEITYSGQSRFEFASGHFESRSSWQAWVVRRNEDGSRRVVILFREGWRRAREPEKTRVTLGFCDIFGDGRLVADQSLGYSSDATRPFRRLPASQQELSRGWASRPAYGRGSSDTVLVRPRAAADPWLFQEIGATPYEEVTQKTCMSTVTFDPARGLVTKIDEEEAQLWGFFAGHGTGTIDLVSVSRREDSWINRLRDETTRFSAALQAYEDRLRQAARDVESCDKLLVEAKGVLTTARAAVSLPVVQERLEDRLNAHAQRAAYYLEEARRRAGIVGHPAADWKAVDLDGRSHALADYRGKVVILEFWSRGCGTCALVGPSLKQVAAEFRGQPVAVLGMTLDGSADARFVVEKLALPFTILRIDRTLLERYGVRGWPTMVVIDPRGIVREMRFGYTPHLHGDLGETVRQLLTQR